MSDNRNRCKFALKKFAGEFKKIPGIRSAVPIYTELSRLVMKSRIASIHRDRVACDIALFNRRGTLGLSEEPRTPRLIVSLSTFPDRVYDVHFSIYSLLTQTCKPDQVVLWLAKDQFPHGEEDVPACVLDMKKHGLTLAWCEDVKSYKKLIPALRSYPNDIIVTADDDIFYPPFWLERLYASYLEHPDAIAVHRALWIESNKRGPLPYAQWRFCTSGTVGEPARIFPATGAGILLPPTLPLHEDIFCADLFMKLALWADDIWVWAMAGLAQRRIRVVEGCVAEITSVNPDREVSGELNSTLWQRNKTENDITIRRVLDHYPDLVSLCCVTPSSSLKAHKSL